MAVIVGSYVQFRISVFVAIVYVWFDSGCRANEEILEVFAVFFLQVGAIWIQYQIFLDMRATSAIQAMQCRLEPTVALADRRTWEDAALGQPTLQPPMFSLSMEVVFLDPRWTLTTFDFLI